MTDMIAGTLGSIPMIVMLLLKRTGKRINLPEKLISDIDAYLERTDGYEKSIIRCKTTESGAGKHAAVFHQPDAKKRN